ncbi:MAG: Poly-beta-1,6-N-acetyl-D-glucosamine synthase [bacterium ADurb.Bin400]|nr:MAG: Poly-beta-1,6-N-acetyl-D-glucosamine synthase [bacterium ADurb.Bin400]
MNQSRHKPSGSLFVSVGIPAHNEEKDIINCLESVENQRELGRIVIEEIITVTDGCDDKTVELATDYAIRHPQVRVISHKDRTGKAVAINTIIREARNDIVILLNADTILDKQCLASLIKPLNDPRYAIVGSHPVCANPTKGFANYFSHLTWRLHHQIALKKPKMSSCIAFRRSCFDQIPTDTPVDDVTMEAVVMSLGYDIAYASNAISYIKGPTTLKDHLTQRRRIHAGYCWAKKHHPEYKTPTFAKQKLAKLIVQEGLSDFKHIPYLIFAVLLEAYSTLQGIYDYYISRYDYQKWPIATTTKGIEQTDRLHAEPNQHP